MELGDWLPPLMVGTTFTVVGALKVYGLARGIVGGRDVPLQRKACGA